MGAVLLGQSRRVCVSRSGATQTSIDAGADHAQRLVRLLGSSVRAAFHRISQSNAGPGPSWVAVAMTPSANEGEPIPLARVLVKPEAPPAADLPAPLAIEATSRRAFGLPY